MPSLFMVEHRCQAHAEGIWNLLKEDKSKKRNYCPVQLVVVLTTIKIKKLRW